MIRRQSSSTNRRRHGLRRLALMLLGCTHALTVGVLIQPTTALGQGEPASAVMTEIWMGGDGLVLTRQIPQDRRSAQESNDDVARSMVETAQQRYREGNRETAIWLLQWAWQLTNGRIGSNGFAETRQNEVGSEFSEVARAGDVPLDPWVADSLVWRPASLEFDPSGPLASIPNMTTDVVERPASPADRAAPELKIESTLSGNALRPDLLPNTDSLPAGPAPETQSRRNESHQVPSDQPVVDQPEMFQSQHAPIIDDTERKVAGAVHDRAHVGVANLVNSELPAKPTVEPITIAAISFVSGTLFCALLCTVLLLVPVRLTIQRQARSQCRVCGTHSSLDRPAETPPANSVSSVSHAHRPVFTAVGEQDRANSVVEEFFHDNVALLERMRDQEIPSVEDANDNSHLHIGAAHG